MQRFNFLRFILTLVYIGILWALIGWITAGLAAGAQPWLVAAACVIGAGCHVASATYYDLAKRLY